MKTFKISALLLAFAVCACTNNSKQQSQSDDGRLEAFSKYFVDQMLSINSAYAIEKGNHQYDTLLRIPTTEYYVEANKIWNSLLDSIHSFKEDNLTDANKIDLWMMRDQAKASLWYLNEFKSYEWNPASFNVSGSFGGILTGNYDKLDTRLRNFSIRLKYVPGYYQSAVQNIKQPVIEHTDLAILQNESSIEEVFGNALKDSVKASTLNNEEKQELLVRNDSARSAIQNYVAWLKNLRKTLTPENSRNFRIGKTLYDKKFEYDIASKYTAEEIFEKAKNRRNELHHEMAEISRKLWNKYFTKPMPQDSLLLIREMIDTLSYRHAKPDSFRSSIEQQMPQLVSFINERKLIYLDPSKPLVVRKTPGYMEGSGAGASISDPGPFDKNGNTYYNVSPLTGYTTEMAESYMREYNYYILQILNMHEAIPGHYTQLVYSNNSPGIIKSLLGNGAMVEGWAVYSERMMLENGYGGENGSKESTPEMWLLYYKWHLRSVCNTILDYSVHVLNMNEQDAKKLLIDGAFQQQAEADGKWQRVKLSQVQLCSYYTGFTEIYDLREEFKKSLGDKFDLKTFHEKFLSYGSAPVKYIAKLMKSETEK